MDIAKRLIQHLKVTARQIVGLGQALYALERLPTITPGIWVKFGLILDVTGRFRNETSYIDFRISEEEFEISRGGYIDLGTGWDSYKEEEVHLNDYEDITEARARIGYFYHTGVSPETPTFGVRVFDTYRISTTNLLLTLLIFGLNKR